MRNDSTIIRCMNGRADRLVRFDSISELERLIGSSAATPLKCGPSVWAKIEAMRSKLYGKFRSSLADLDTVRMDCIGSDYDMGLSISGDPDCWIDIQSAPSPMYRIGVNPSSNIGSDPISLVNRGAALCAIIDLIESIGGRMEIEWCYGVSGVHSNYGEFDIYRDLVPDSCGPDPERQYHVRVMMKRTDAPLDLKRIADWICAHKSAGSITGSGDHENPTDHGIHVVNSIQRALPTRHQPSSCHYQFWASPSLKGEYDIVMDRIEQGWTAEYTESWVEEQIKSLQSGTHAALAA